MLLGIDPTIKLISIFNSLRCTRHPNDGGILPEMQLEENRRSVNDDIQPIEVGIVPDILLYARSST